MIIRLLLAAALSLSLFGASFGQASSYNELLGLGSHSVPSTLKKHILMQDNAASTTVVDRTGIADEATGGTNTSTLATTGPNSYLTSAFNLNGTSQYVNLDAVTGAPSGSAARTIFIRFNSDTNSTAADKPLFEYVFDSSPGTLFAAFYEDDAVSVAYNAHRTITPKSTLSTGTWYSFAVVVPSGATTTGDIVDYINGVAQTLSDEAGSAQTLNTTTPNIEVGRYNATNYFDGKVCDFGISSAAWTAAEVLQWHAGPEPVNSVAPAVSGTETEGETLTSTSGTWGLDSPFASGSNGTVTYAYQWTRSNDGTGTGEADISGATSSTYTLQAADVGRYIRCRVAASNDGGNDSGADTNSNFTGVIAASGGGAKPWLYRPINQILSRSQRRARTFTRQFETEPCYALVP